MGFANTRMPLLAMQESLAMQLKEINVISDLNLAEEDYRYLATKIKMLFKFSNDDTVVEDYKLSIVVYWVFSMIYWEKQHLNSLEMEKLFEGMPQYKKRYYMDICMETFDEYGLYLYEINYTDIVLRTRMMVARHASIPQDEQRATFAVVSHYLDCNLVADMTEAIMMELPPKTQAIFCCFDDMTKQKAILDLRNLMIVCKNGQKSRKVLEHDYPYISHHVIEAMMEWCRQQEQLKIV